MRVLFQIAVIIILSSSTAFAGGIGNVSFKRQSLVLDVQHIIRIDEGDAFTVRNVTALSSQLIPLQINLPGYVKSSTKKMWLRVIGLPQGLKFSAGVSVNEVWFIPIQDVGKLSLALPEGYTGQFSLDFFLMRNDRPVVSIVGKQKVNVTVLAKRRAPKKVENKSESEEATPAVKISEKEEKILLDRAKELMKLGTYSPARLIYKELAKLGSVKGALELAKTYDPDIIRETPISGMKPDPEQARKWYKRARELSGGAF